MLNDADIEMVELAEAADMGANGVCSICTDILDPHDPKWDPARFPTTRLADGTTRPTTRDEYAAMVGPIHPQLPWHVYCMEDNDQ